MKSGKSIKSIILSIALLNLSFSIGCANISPNTNANLIASQKHGQISISGKVQFPDKFKTKADIGDILNNSTVSLIYPSDYQDSNLQGKTIATGISDNAGVFRLNADPNFDPIVGQIFILEATKRIEMKNGEIKNGAAISLRTYVKWNGQSFDSITGNNIYINVSTTSLAIMARFNTIKPEDTIGQMSIVDGQTQINPIDITRDNMTVHLTTTMIGHVKDLVESSLASDIDPIYSIYYQQQRFLLRDVSLATINKLRGCISLSGNCAGVNNSSIELVPTLNTTIPTTYLIRKDDIQVNTTTFGNQTDVSIGINKSGTKKVVAWVSNDGDQSGIYAQIYDSQGQKVGSEFRVKDDIAGSQFIEYGTKNVAVSDDGSFVIIWTQWDANGWGIFGEKFNSDGSKVNYFRVNDYEIGEQRYPSISAVGNGDYVVSWSSYAQDGSGWGIYAKQLIKDTNNTSQFISSSEFLVNSTTSNEQISPDVAAASNGDFIISWCGVDSSQIWQIYAQKYNSNGTANGSEFKVNSSGTIFNYNPSIGIDSTGKFVITWFSTKSDGYNDVYARKFNSDTSSDGNDFQVNSSVTAGDQGNPKISMNDSGDYVIVWHDFSGNDGSGWGVHARRYHSNGTVDNEFVVSKYRRKNQMYPAIAISNAGDYSIAWSSEGQDNSGYGIFMQNLLSTDNTDYSDISGNPVQGEGCGNVGAICLTGEQQINTLTQGDQSDVSIAMNKANGNHVAVWTSENIGTTGGKSVKAQLFNSVGQKLGSEIKVTSVPDDVNNSVSPLEKGVGMDEQGNFIIVWSTYGYGSDNLGWGIYAQKYKSNGQKDRNPFRVNDNTFLQQIYPSISMNSTGDYVIAWTTNQNNDSQNNTNIWDIYAKKYTGNTSTSEFKVNTTSSENNNVSTPDVFLSNNGKYVISWTSHNTNPTTNVSTWNILAQMFDENNNKLGNEQQINDNSSGMEDYDSDVILDSNDRAIFTWGKKTSSGYDVFLRTLTYNQLQNSLVLSSEILAESDTSGEQGEPSLALLYNNKFVITWENLSNVTGQGYKVYARMFDSTLAPVSVSGSGTNEFVVNTFTGNNQYSSELNRATPKIASDNNGNFNIVWISEGQDGSGKSVHIRRFNSDGSSK